MSLRRTIRQSFMVWSPFDRKSGEVVNKKEEVTYTDVFSGVLCKLAEKNEKIAGITAAMPDGTGLKRFKQRYKKRFFDVGIAEEHAVTFAAGLAAAGYKPYVAIYSSFLQRSYDQILHDVCIQDLPVVFAIDRAGLVGGDGETHQGIFDLSFLSSIPNMSIFAPKNRYELVDILKYSTYFSGPLAIRYPRGVAYDGLKEFRAPIKYGKSEILYMEKDIALIAVGAMVETGVNVRDILKKSGYYVSVINGRFVKPIDEECIQELTKNHNVIVTLEENVIKGGFGESVLRYVVSLDKKIKVLNIGVPNIYLERGSVKELRREAGLDENSIVRRIEDLLKED